MKDWVGLAVSAYHDDSMESLVGTQISVDGELLPIVADIGVYPGHIMPIKEGSMMAANHGLSNRCPTCGYYKQRR